MRGLFYLSATIGDPDPACSGMALKGENSHKAMQLVSVILLGYLCLCLNLYLPDKSLTP